MKKILLISTLAASLLLSSNIEINVPIDTKHLSTDSGGSNSAYDSYQDGIGVFFAKRVDGNDSRSEINEAMNKLVYSHGKEAKENGESLKEYVLSNGSNEEKELAEKLVVFEGAEIVEPEISECEDNDPFTKNEKLIDGECIGEGIDVHPSSIVDWFPGSNVNWNVNGNTYSSTGQYSSKFFKLNQNNISKITMNVTGTGSAGMMVLIAPKAKSGEFGGKHMQLPYAGSSSTYFYYPMSTRIEKIHGYNKTIEIYIDPVNLKYKVNNVTDGVQGEVLDLSNPGGPEISLGISDGSSSSTGTAEILKIEEE